MNKEHKEINVLDELYKGTCMGIIEGRKLLNHKDTNKDVHDLIQEYVDMQEDAVENFYNKMYNLFFEFSK